MTPLKHPIRDGLLFLALAAFVTACETTPPREEPPTEPARERAADLLERGDLEGAAAVYWTQAQETSSPQREELQLRAVEAVLTPKTAGLARQYLDAVLGQDLRGPLLVRARIAQARLALIDRQPAEALFALPPGIALTTPQFETQVDELRAQALLGTGQILPSVRVRSLLSGKLEDPRELKMNRRKLWWALGRASEPEMARWAQAETDPTLRGWLELSYIAKTSPSEVKTFNRELDTWRQRYPGHPANATILGQLRKDWKALQLRPRQIAVLLPLTGPLASVAEAVLAGFMAAYYGDEEDPADRPEVRVYDVGGNDAATWAQYTRAVQNGAELVVGPLDKEGVAVLGSHKGLPVPVLTLNYSEHAMDPPGTLYEFGLLPEDEARQVAERAALAGYDTALALAPEGEWGGRLLDAFSHRFQELGGQVVAAQRYEEMATDFSAPIKDVLGINASVLRYTNLRALLNRDLEFEPRRRPDADMLFMAALPGQARLLLPQLHFHYAAELPVYATSHIYTGLEDSGFDRDIDGVIYCDMPWMLTGANPQPALKSRIARLFPLASQQLARLIALGFDAYGVIPYLKRLDERGYERYTGLTGDLRMDDLGRIHRELKWGRFVDGEPRLLDRLETEPVPETFVTVQ